MGDRWNEKIKKICNLKNHFKYLDHPNIAIENFKFKFYFYYFKNKN